MGEYVNKCSVSADVRRSHARSVRAFASDSGQWRRALVNGAVAERRCRPRSQANDAECSASYDSLEVTSDVLKWPDRRLYGGLAVVVDGPVPVSLRRPACASEQARLA